jgi:hypothetical protein
MAVTVSEERRVVLRVAFSPRPRRVLLGRNLKAMMKRLSVCERGVYLRGGRMLTLIWMWTWVVVVLV